MTACAFPISLLAGHEIRGIQGLNEVLKGILNVIIILRNYDVGYVPSYYLPIIVTQHFRSAMVAVGYLALAVDFDDNTGAVINQLVVKIVN